MKAQFQETATESRILLPPSPLLHSAFFKLTLINLGAINEIYHWHKLAREGKKGVNRKTMEIRKMRSQRAGGHKPDLKLKSKHNKPTSGKL